MTIRPYAPDDLPALHRIDRICFPPGISYSLAELRDYIERPRSRTWVAQTDEGNIVGFITAQLERMGRGARQRMIGHIITIDVLPEYRRQGWGGKLLERAEQWLRERGAQWVILETAVDNRPAHSFYARHGYTVLRVLHRYYADGVDAYLMGKRLHARQTS